MWFLNIFKETRATRRTDGIGLHRALLNIMKTEAAEQPESVEK